MKNEGKTDIEKPDNRRAYSKPRLKRLGKLDEIAKRGLKVNLEPGSIIFRS